MDWYYKFLNWFKGKYGYDIWDKKHEGEEGKYEGNYIKIGVWKFYNEYDELDEERNYGE